MKSSNHPSRGARGYTLVEVLVAVGIVSMAIGAASKLSMSMTLQEELNTRKSVVVNYGENVARLWQLGVEDPSTILIAPDGVAFSLSTVSDANLPEGVGVEGKLEKATLTLTFKPSDRLSDGVTVPADQTISFDVLRLPDGHR